MPDLENKCDCRGTDLCDDCERARCAALPHVECEIIEDGEGGTEYRSACPKCGALSFACAWDEYMLCKCGQEYACNEPEGV